MDTDKTGGSDEQTSIREPQAAATIEEMLAAVLARLITLEATQMSLLVVTTEVVAELPNKPSMQKLGLGLASVRRMIINNQLDSVAVQFPQFEKLLRDYVLIAAADGRDFWDSFVKDVGDGTA